MTYSSRIQTALADAALGLMGKIASVLRKPMDLKSYALQVEIRKVLKK